MICDCKTPFFNSGQTILEAKETGIMFLSGKVCELCKEDVFTQKHTVEHEVLMRIQDFEVTPNGDLIMPFLDEPAGVIHEHDLGRV